MPASSLLAPETTSAVMGDFHEPYGAVTLQAAVDMGRSWLDVVSQSESGCQPLHQTLHFRLHSSPNWKPFFMTSNPPIFMVHSSQVKFGSNFFLALFLILGKKNSKFSLENNQIYVIMSDINIFIIFILMTTKFHHFLFNCENTYKVYFY